MRIVDKLAVPVIFIAGGMVYLAEKFELPFLILLAIAVFGVFALLLGAGLILYFGGEWFAPGKAGEFLVGLVESPLGYPPDHIWIPYPALRDHPVGHWQCP